MSFPRVGDEVTMACMAGGHTQEIKIDEIHYHADIDAYQCIGYHRCKTYDNVAAFAIIHPNDPERDTPMQKNMLENCKHDNGFYKVSNSMACNFCDKIKGFELQ